MAKLQPDYIKWVLTLNASQAQEEFHKLEKSNKNLKKETDAYRAAMAKLVANGQQNSKEWANLNKMVTANGRAMSENRAKMSELSKTFDLGSMTVKQLRKRLKDLRHEFDSTSKAMDPQRYKDLQNQIGETRKALDSATGQTGKLKDSFISLSKTKEIVTGFFFSIGATILSVITGTISDAFNIIVEFEKANSRLASILGVSKGEIKDLTAAARELGATTSYSAAQVTELQIELAKLGFGKEQIKAMESGVLKFAKAVDTDLARASAFAGAALRIFGKDAEDTEDVLASFAIVTTKTSLDFAKLESSLATVGPVAYAAGFSIEETAALLGTLANNGFDASSAATALRNIMLNLSDSNSTLSQALGGSVNNLDDLRAGLIRLEQEGVDLQKALDMTDKRSVAAFMSIMKGAGDLDGLRDSITGCTDAFDKMSEEMSDNLGGSLASLSSASYEVILKIGDILTGPLRSIVDGLTSVVNAIGDVIEWLDSMRNVLGPLAKAVLVYVGALKALNIVGKLTRNIFNGLRGVISGFGKIFISAKNGCKNFTGSLKAANASAKAGTISFRALGAAMKALPWTAILSAVTTVISLISDWISETDEAEEATERLGEAELKEAQRAEEMSKGRKNMAHNIDVERAKLLELQKVAADENKSRAERLDAIKELNRICPNYNAHLAGERGELVANKKALDEYIASMEKRMRVAYFKDEYAQYIGAQAEAERELLKARKKVDSMSDADRSAGASNMNAYKRLVRGDDTTIRADNTAANVNTPVVPGLTDREVESIAKNGMKAAESLLALEQAANTKRLRDTQLRAFMQEMEDMGITVVDLVSEGSESVNTLSSSFSGVADSASTVVDEVKSLRAELKKLNKEDPQNDDDYNRIKARKKQIRERLKVLNGSTDKKHVGGTYQEDSLDQATASADDLHQKNMLEINKRKGEISNAEFIIAKNKEVIRYSTDLIKALENLRAETDKTHTQTLDKIDAEQNKILQDVLTAQQEINAASVTYNKELHDDSMKALAAGYENQKNIVQRAVNNQIITQEQADVYMMARERQLHEDQLAELRRYYVEVKNCDLIGAAEKTKNLEDLAAKIRQMTSQTLTDAGKWAEMIRSLTTNVSGIDGIKGRFEVQRQALMGTYDQAIAIQKQLGQDTTALEAERQNRLAALNYQYQEQMWQLQENVGLSWADEYDRELASLENMHRQGLISEKDYQKKKLELGVNNAKKYFDYYSQLSGSMVSAIQEAEIAQVDAKYDVLIQQAKNNGEDTAALEEEKENKKLEIQKKYADVDFAIKVSQIIADTAVSAMKTYAQFGWPWGIIPAAMVSATGIAQIAVAKAERDKIKNMQPGNTAGAKAPAKTERVLSGYSEGGYTGDGGRYEVAGVVHRGEYVVPMPIMDNPRVIDAVGTIEAIRRNRTPGPVDDMPRMPHGFADGGYTGGSVHVDVSELSQVVKELKSAVKNIRAYVLIKDIKKAEDDLARARKPFTRNN